jgi:hypothetical protein
MLYTIDKEPIEYIPYTHNYNLWRSRLTVAEYDAIVNELNGRVNQGPIHTSSWIPGSDWTGTVFQPIYEKACNHNEDLSGRCFGLFLWVVMMERPEAWAFGRYEKDNIPIRGLTYFRIDI